MEKQIIGFLGAGNMGSALIHGLILDGYPADHLWLCDKHSEKLKQLSESAPDVHTTQNPKELIEQVQVLVLAIKPQGLIQTLCDLKSDILKKAPLIISIAAGISTENIQKEFINLDMTLTNIPPDAQTHPLPLIRAMPNTPAQLQAGITALYAHPNYPISLAHKQCAQDLFNAVGDSIWIESEALMDLVTALSGSGPAYFFYILEAFIRSASQLGLDPYTAHSLITHTMLGAAKMAVNTVDLAVMRQQVTSKGGTTEAGISILQDADLPALIAQALTAATKRAQQLNRGLNTP